MKQIARRKIVIVGCGNLAWHLATHFRSIDGFSVSVYNHRANPNLAEFKKKLACKITVGLDDIEKDGDFYFTCVSDKFISAVSRKINVTGRSAVIFHCSGSAELSEIRSLHANKAVLYPLQTFSKGDKLDWKEIPMIIETANPETAKIVKGFVKHFGGRNLFLGYRQRLTFHLAAVLVNNFTNALYAAAYKLIEQGQGRRGAHLLLPLIMQTTSKLRRLEPLSAQTGPARRKDSQVMKKHLALLKDQPDLYRMYKILSSIITQQQDDAQL